MDLLKKTHYKNILGKIYNKNVLYIYHMVKKLLSKRVLYGVIILMVVVAFIYFLSTKEGMTTTQPKISTTQKPKPIITLPVYPTLAPIVPSDGLNIPIYDISLQRSDPSDTTKTFITNNIRGYLIFFSSTSTLPSCFTPPTGGLYCYVQFNSQKNPIQAYNNNKGDVTKLELYFLDTDCNGPTKGTLTDFSKIKIPNPLFYNNTVKNFRFTNTTTNTNVDYTLNCYGKPIPPNPTPFPSKCSCSSESHRFYYVKT